MSKPVILLAERDCERRQELYARLLTQGYEIIESFSPIEVLRVLRHRRRIDLFLLSTSLESRGDGVELARLILHHGNSPQVILLAGQDGVDWTTAVRAAGVMTYVGKHLVC